MCTFENLIFLIELNVWFLFLGERWKIEWQIYKIINFFMRWVVGSDENDF